MQTTEKRVLVGMSGGIDSSVVCLMLQEQGYEVVGVTLRTWDVPSHFSTPGQEEPDEVLEARSLARRLGIEHHVADVREEFRQVIVRYFIDEYMRGRTPNPSLRTLQSDVQGTGTLRMGRPYRMCLYCHRTLLPAGRQRRLPLHCNRRRFYQGSVLLPLEVTANHPPADDIPFRRHDQSRCTYLSGRKRI